MPIPGKNSTTYPYGFSFVIKKASGSLRNSIENLIKNSGLVPVEKKAIQNIEDYKPSQLLDIINFLKSRRKIVDLGNNFFIHQNYLKVLLNCTFCKVDQYK